MKKLLLILFASFAIQSKSQDFMDLPILDKAAVALVGFMGLEFAYFTLIQACKSLIDTSKLCKHDDNCSNCEKNQKYRPGVSLEDMTQEHLINLKYQLGMDASMMAICAISATAFLRAAQRLAK